MVGTTSKLRTSFLNEASEGILKQGQSFKAMDKSHQLFQDSSFPLTGLDDLKLHGNDTDVSVSSKHRRIVGKSADLSQ